MKKIRKVLSLITAIAMSASAFTAALTAHAEGEELLWSDTFNYAIPENSYGTNDWCTGYLVQGAGTGGQTYTAIDGVTLRTNSAADDSSYWCIGGDGTDNYITTSTARFSAKDGRTGSQMTFAEAFTPTAEKDVVLDFDLKFIEPRAACYDSAFEVVGTNGITLLNKADIAGAEFDTWIDMRIVVTTTGTSIYAGANATPVTTSEVNDLTALHFNSYQNGVRAEDQFRIDGQPHGYPSYSFNDMVVYSTPAGTGVTSTAPQAQTHAKYSVTIKRVCGSQPLADDVTLEVAAGTEYTVPKMYKMSVDNGTNYYAFSSMDFTDGAAINTDTVITLTFEDKAKENAESEAYDFEDGTTDPFTTTDKMTVDFAAAGTDPVTADINGTNALSLTSSGAGTSSLARATLDLSAVTEGKSNVTIALDSYFPSGNYRIIAGTYGAENPSNYYDTGIFGFGMDGENQYKIDGKRYDGNLGKWIRTTIEYDFNTKNLRYTSVNLADNSVVVSDIKAITAQEVTKLIFTSWNDVTAYIDNISISAWGEFQAELAATPEPVAEDEGSGISLTPETAEATLFTFARAADGAGTEVLNHSNASTATALDKDSAINLYDGEKTFRGKSVYAVYDVLVKAGDMLNLKAYQSNGTTLGPQFKITGNKDGTAVVQYEDAKDKVTTVGTLSANTWYRVLIEIPQLNNSGNTKTGNSIYTVYRIDPTDCTKVKEVALQATGIGPRNITSATTMLQADVTGTPSIDNGETFLMPSNFQYLYTPEAAATAEGSAVVNGAAATFSLAPESAMQSSIASLEAIEGTAVKVLNHTEAKPATASADTKLTVDYERSKGKSTYVAYDVYVGAGDKLSLAAQGNGTGEPPVGSTFVIEGGATGKALAYGFGDKGEQVTLSGDLRTNTWYRAVIEIPNEGQESTTATGKGTFTIYRIDPTDCSKVTEIAAQSKEIGPRNLADKNCTAIVPSVTGTPYIDNGVQFIAASGLSYMAPYAYGDVTVTQGSGKVTVATENAALTSAVIFVASYNDKGVLTNVKVGALDLTSGSADYTVNLTSGMKIMVFDAVSGDKSGMMPLCAVQPVQ